MRGGNTIHRGKSGQLRLVQRYLHIAILTLSSALYATSYADPLPFDSFMDNTLYHLASEQNDPAAQYLLGRKLFTGSSVEKNVEEAIKWFKLAAAQNHTKAQFQLGKMYLYGEEGVKINYVYALGYLRDAANNNYAEAQYELGNYYLMGKAENADYTKAIKWYRAAAEQQHVRAMVALGKILYEGEGGIKPRPDEARHFLSLAAEYGDADAIQGLRKISNHTQSSARNSASVTAFHAQLNDAASGHIPSQYEVGMAYLKGNGVDMDAELAAKWLRRAAVNDYSEAQYMLSHLYRDGVGVRKDRKRALEWLRIAASAGINEAQKELQSMHLSNTSLDEVDETYTAEGQNSLVENAVAMTNTRVNHGSQPPTNDSTERNPVAAPKVSPPSSPAAKSSTVEAEVKVEANARAAAKPRQKQTPPNLASRSLSVPQLELQPTTADDQFRLGIRYLNGDRIGKDVSKAVYWMEQAATQFHVEAQYQLGKMYKNGVGVTASAAKAKYWLSQASYGGYDKADVLLKDLRDINISENFNIGPPKVISVSLKSTRSDKTEPKKNTPPPTLKTVKTSDSPAPAKHPPDRSNNAAGVDSRSHVDESIDSTLSKNVSDHPSKNHSTKISDHAADEINRSPPEKPQGELTQAKAGMIAQIGKSQQPTNEPDNELKWLLETANDNNKEAQLKLAEMYATGRGVPRDIFTAAEWYRKAAKLGNAEAQFKLGDMYKEGLGVEKNNSIAIMWYRKAANQGYEEAKRRLGGCRIC